MHLKGRVLIPGFLPPDIQHHVAYLVSRQNELGG